MAVNPETDEEEFYLAQLREDVFAKVQSVVHVLWLEPVEENDKSVWEFEEFDTIPCGSIICRVALKVSVLTTARTHRTHTPHAHSHRTHRTHAVNLMVTLCVGQDGGKDNETMLLSEAERQRNPRA